MPKQGSDRLVIVDDMPAITKLWNSRYRLEFYCSPSDGNEGWYGDNISKWLPSFGTLQSANFSGDGWSPRTGEAYSNMCLVEAALPYIPASEKHLVTLTYETLTTSWVLEKEEDTDYELNGLQRIKRTYVSLPETDYTNVVGTATITSGGKTLYLGGYDIKKTEAKWVLEEIWLEAGLINTSISNGPTSIPGTTRVTYESIGVEISPATGVLLESRDVNAGGFTTYIRTKLQGNITGTNTTYKDVAEVRVAGTVDLKAIAKSVGGISGTIAVAEVTPPRTKKVPITVTIDVVTTPPNTINLAYDLGNISCSVTFISMSENFRGTDVFTTPSGTLRFSGRRKSADMSARISTYPECYLLNLTSNNGTFSYVSSYENTSTGSTLLTTNPLTSTTNTFAEGTGSTAADYATTGILKRNSRPVLTALDGTVYYEVITWTV